MIGEKLDTKSFKFLFIIASLGVFLILAMIDLIFVSVSIPLTRLPEESAAKPIDQPDPLLTRVPTLKNVIKSPLLSASDPILGDATAPVKIFIFSDFTCSYCDNQEKILRLLFDAFPGKIRLIWKDYPEKNSRSISWQAAVAARCAQTENKFWMMHDLLFGKKELSVADLKTFASTLGLDMKRFADCLSGEVPKKLIEDDMLEANTLDINGVPFIFVNDREFMGEADLEELKAAIEAELKK